MNDYGINSQVTATLLFSKRKGENMSYTLKTDLANRSNYGGQRNTNKIKYLVFHATSNDGDTDESNAAGLGGTVDGEIIA